MPDASSSVSRSSESGRRTILHARYRIVVCAMDAEVRALIADELAAAFDVTAPRSYRHAARLVETSSGLAAVVADLGDSLDGDECLALLSRVRVAAPPLRRILVCDRLAHVELAVQSGLAHRAVERPWPPGALVAAVGG